MSSTTIRPPGPRGLPYLGCALSYMSDPFNYLQHLASEYGDVVRSTVAGASIFQLNHPDHVEHVLLRNRSNYVKDRFLLRLKAVVGEGLLTSEGALWRRHRKQMAAAFTPRRVASYAPTVVACARRIQAGWVEGEQVDLSHDMMQLTLEVAVRTLFGTRAGAGQDIQRVERAFARVNDYYTRTVGNLPMWVPTPRNLTLRRAKRELDEVVARIISERRADVGQGEDLLSALLRGQAADTSEAPMSDAHLRDQVLTLLLAGHETTALTLTYTLHLLARHPEVEQRVVAELEDVVGDRDPGVEDLPRLRALGQVVTESLRLYPPVSIMGRESVSEDTIGGWRIPPDSIVVLPQWVIQRDPRWYADPEAFRPERWTDAFRASLPRFSYFPFGGGQRVCIGEAFALLEAKLALAALLQRHRFQAVEPGPLALVSAITMRPKRPVRALVATRGATRSAAFTG